LISKSKLWDGAVNARQRAQITEALDELEGHLREELARQQKLGLSASAAFEAAIQQMGQTGAVAGEFGKTARAPKASPGVMVGICAVLVASIVWLSGFTLNQMNVSIGGQIQAYAAVLLSLAIACGWRYAVPFLPVSPTRGNEQWSPEAASSRGF
jgi:hypothetical protein